MQPPGNSTIAARRWLASQGATSAVAPALFARDSVAGKALDFVAGQHQCASHSAADAFEPLEHHHDATLVDFTDTTDFMTGAWRFAFCNRLTNQQDLQTESTYCSNRSTRKSKFAMSKHCDHLDTIRTVTPSALGCEECLAIGSAWVHLRLCRTCGHVGCCDDSPHKHASAHFRETTHPIIEGYDPPEAWGWCYVDKVVLNLRSVSTPQRGPIPRYY